MTPAAPTDRAPSRLTILLCMALLCLIWGSTWLVIREGLKDLSPFTSAGVRFALAAAVMALIAPAIARREGGRRPTPRLTLVMGLFNFAGSYGIVYWSETLLPSGLVSVLWSVFPMMMAVAAHLALPGERLLARQWLGFVVGFLGVVLLLARDVAAIGGEALVAALVLLGSPLAATLGTTYVKKHGARVSSALLNRDAMAVGAAALLACALLSERGAPMHWSAPAVWSVVYLAIPGTVVTFGLYFWAMRYAPAHQLSLIAYVIPAVALFLGVSLGGETVGASTLAGAALILGGVACVLLGRRRPMRPESVRAPAQGSPPPAGLRSGRAP